MRAQDSDGQHFLWHYNWYILLLKYMFLIESWIPGIFYVPWNLMVTIHTQSAGQSFNIDYNNALNYFGDPNTGNIWKPDFLVSVFKIMAMMRVLDTSIKVYLTIWQLSIIRFPDYSGTRIITVFKSLAGKSCALVLFWTWLTQSPFFTKHWLFL